jgi:hypothetical protein
MSGSRPEDAGSLMSGAVPALCRDSHGGVARMPNAAVVEIAGSNRNLCGADAQTRERAPEQVEVGVRVEAVTSHFWRVKDHARRSGPDEVCTIRER